MKNLNLTRLFAILIIAFTFTVPALAVTIQDVGGSDLTATQKKAVIDLIDAGSGNQADDLFNQYKDEQVRAQINADLEAQVKTEQAETKKALIKLIKPLKIEDVWPAVTEFMDTNDHDDFVIQTLAQRYGFDDDVEFDTLADLQAAYEKRSADRKAEAARLAELNGMIDAKIESATTPIYAALGTVSNELATTKADVADLTEVISSFAGYVETDDDIQDDSVERFEQIRNRVKRERERNNTK